MKLSYPKNTGQHKRYRVLRSFDTPLKCVYMRTFVPF